MTIRERRILRAYKPGPLIRFDSADKLWLRARRKTDESWWAKNTVELRANLDRVLVWAVIVVLAISKAHGVI